MAIERIAYFGDSYCADAKLLYSDKGPHFPYFWPTKSYIDHLSDQTGLPIVHRGRSGHGPNFTITEFIDWLDNNRDLIPTTQFIWCWSDPGRELLIDPNKLEVEDSLSETRHAYDLERLSEPKEWHAYNQSRGVTDNQHYWHEPDHPGEYPSPGPDSPMVQEYYDSDVEEKRRWAKAFKLYYLYLRNSGDSHRRFIANCKLFQYIIKDYDVKHIQNYRCFTSYLYKNENNFDMTQCMPDCTFTWQGQTQTNLFDFARHPDFRYGIDNNDSGYPCHFSPSGQKAFASIIMDRMKQNL